MRQDTTQNESGAKSFLNKYVAVAGPVAFLGLIGLIVALVADKRSFYTSYMFAYFFWFNLTLGCTTLTILHHCIRASWSYSILRVLEAGNKILPWMAVFFIPILIGMFRGDIYQWSNPEVVAASELLQRKAWMLNRTGYTVRSVIYFAYWIGVTWWLNKSAALQDKTGNERLAEQRASFAAPAGVFHVVLLTFAYTDWIMSLDPAWYSTIYGVWHMISGVVAALALSIIVIMGFSNRAPFSSIMTPTLTKNLGNMLLGFTMFWAYVSLSQFLIIWCANLPEEISFYINRFNGALVFIGAFIIVGQFFGPFLVLLSGRTKRTPQILLRVAIWVICVRAIDMWWQVTPFFRKGTSMAYLADYALDLGAFAFIGGAWTLAFVFNLRRNSLLHAHDSRLEEAKAHAHA